MVLAIGAGVAAVGSLYWRYRGRQRLWAASLCVARLEVAAAHGWTDEVRRFLADGADIEGRGTWGCTPLQIASYYGRDSVVLLLLEHGADASTTDDVGATSMHYAALRGDVEVMRLLVEKVADLSIKDDIGETALHCAAWPFRSFRF